MSTVLVIGAGGVSSVCVHKMAMNKDIFSDIHLASRTKSKCDAIAASVKDRTGVEISTYEIDAEEVPAMVNLIKKIGPKLVVNLALPYQDLPIMDACLEAGCNYMDTANYEPRDVAKFEYHWQWAYHDRFKEKGITAIEPGAFRGFRGSNKVALLLIWRNSLSSLEPGMFDGLGMPTALFRLPNPCRRSTRQPGGQRKKWAS